MFVLRLNDMRSAQVELLTSVARADTKEALRAYLEAQTVPGYSDGRWGKIFKQGGPLEWYNAPLASFEDDHFVDTLSREAYLGRMAENYDREIGSLPQVPA